MNQMPMVLTRNYCVYYAKASDLKTILCKQGSRNSEDFTEHYEAKWLSQLLILQALISP